MKREKPVTPCRHCQKRAFVARRELCGACYRDSEVRKLYPTLPNRGRSCGQQQSDFNLGDPTEALPGTPEKFKVLCKRAEAGAELFHPKDRCRYSQSVSGEAFIIVDSKGRWWTGKTWSRNWQAALPFAEDPDAARHCEIVAQSLRDEGADCWACCLPAWRSRYLAQRPASPLGSITSQNLSAGKICDTSEGDEGTMLTVAEPGRVGLVAGQIGAARG